MCLNKQMGILNYRMVKPQYSRAVNTWQFTQQTKQKYSIIQSILCQKVVSFYVHQRSVHLFLLRYFSSCLFLQLLFRGENITFATLQFLLTLYTINFCFSKQKTTVLEKFVLRLANAFNPRMKFSYIITLFMLNTKLVISKRQHCCSSIREMNRFLCKQLDHKTN